MNRLKSQHGKADQVVEEWHEGANFYRKYASGFIEQGGFKAQGAGYYVTLFKSFSSADYSVVATDNAKEGSGAQGVCQAHAAYPNRFLFAPQLTVWFTTTPVTGTHLAIKEH